jgi:restriction system protein
MAVPDYESLMLPVLRLTAEGMERIPKMLPHLKSEFALSDQEMQELLPSGRTPILASRAHWARTYLVKAGLLESRARGVCAITERGRSVLSSGPERLSNKELSQYAEFAEWRERSAMRQVPVGEVGANIIKPGPSAETPDEAIEQAFRQLEAALVDDVLARVLEITPKQFEQLIVNLLVAMGYGGGMEDAGRAIGRSGDGGIDGIINEDPLGLDRVYIQAKRYGLDIKVGRPAIQQFVGSLTGESATKGVFVTTSEFSADARAYAERVQQRIILINGQHLARLMIAHEVGGALGALTCCVLWTKTSSSRHDP